ncbi:hypothetical protein JCM11251_002200 [Rhodosporidiobolus azoricus]
MPFHVRHTYHKNKIFFGVYLHRRGLKPIGLSFGPGEHRPFAAALLKETTTVNLHKLKLSRVPDEPAELDSEEEDAYFEDEDEIRQARYMKKVRYNIVPRNGRELGYVNEMSDFAATIFTPEGKFEKPFKREGTRVWGSEVTHDRIRVCLDMIKVKLRYRRQGIATWALNALGPIGEPYFGVQNISFLFTWPTIHWSEFSDTWDFGKSDPQKKEKDAALKRNIRFLQKAGFRRVGTTKYFCCAYVPQASHNIPRKEDAKEGKTIQPRVAGDARLIDLLAQQFRGCGRQLSSLPMVWMLELVLYHEINCVLPPGLLGGERREAFR